MVKIINEFGDVKRGKQHTVVYQGHYGNQTRRMLKDKKDEHTRGQLEQRERFRVGIDFAKSLTKPQRDFIKSYMAEAGIRSPDGLPTTWYSFVKKIAMTRPKVEMETEAGGEGFPGTYAAWTYRKPITINNSDSTLTNYPVLITLTTSNFTYAQCKEDGSDIRFSRDDKTTPLPYWVEDWNYNGDSKIWVNVDSIPTGENVSLYLFYGNATATSETHISNTFIDGWDFENDTIGNVPAGWTEDAAHGSFRVVAGKTARLQHSSGEPVLSNNYVPLTAITGDNDRVIQFTINTALDPTLDYIIIHNSSEHANEGIFLAFCETGQIRYYAGGWHVLQLYDANTDYKFKIYNIDLASNQFDIDINGVNKGVNLSFASAQASLNYFTYEGSGNLNVDENIDNLFIRKHTTPEPSVSSFGEEDVNEGGTILKAFTIHHPAIKSYELADSGMKEESISNLEDHISTVVTKTDLNLSETKIKVKTLANQDYEFIVKQQ